MSWLCCASSEDGICSGTQEGNTMIIGYTGSAPINEVKGEVRLVEVKLDLSLGSNVGVAFDVQDKSHPVVKEVFGGLLEMWNSSCLPEQEVKVFDRLVEVDGKSGSKMDLCDRLSEQKDAMTGTMVLKFARPKEKKVTLKKKEGKDFGVTLNYYKSSMKVIIAGVEPNGITADWNEQHPDTPVLADDVIVEVNGVSGSPIKMVSELKKSEEPELTVLQY
mmetsp:Transcript_23885/g.51980  ORF Transcript_23885/g.51980 Transcript_23885/m.51980 type:complete len:219 (-) Transcript_23885:96-752(-)